jgi:hypothetical protein
MTKTFKQSEEQIDLPEDFHEAAVNQFKFMIGELHEQQLATVPMQNVDGQIYPAIVSMTKPQVCYGVLFVPPVLLNPMKDAN